MDRLRLGDWVEANAFLSPDYVRANLARRNVGRVEHLPSYGDVGVAFPHGRFYYFEPCALRKLSLAEIVARDLPVDMQWTDFR